MKDVQAEISRSVRVCEGHVNVVVDVGQSEEGPEGCPVMVNRSLNFSQPTTSQGSEQEVVISCRQVQISPTSYEDPGEVSGGE